MSERRAIECAIIRGGTSKGVYIHLDDLPESREERLKLIHGLMGDDATQLDGLGGGNVLSSKVALVTHSKEEGVDLDYHFVQVLPARGVDDTPPCGNILSGVGLFAVETGLVGAGDPSTTITVRDINTGSIVEQELRTPGGRYDHTGDEMIPGARVPGAPIVIRYRNITGRVTGKLWPTGSHVDEIDGVPMTLVDGAIPVILLPGEQVGLSLHTHMRLGNMRQLIDKLLRFRSRISAGAGIDSENTSMPKVAALFPPSTGDSDIAIRYFTPHTPHSSVAVTGGISIAIAAICEGTVAHEISSLVEVPAGDDDFECRIEHFAGITPFRLHFAKDGKGEPYPESASLVRTSRLLMRGTAYAPV